ncbi:MAG: ATP-binding cassette domain-containing protein [Candidatus Bathyarchaeota archaeon]|nr:ATP-binding cassette domain-containing protein [Candidatus Bathyarchaeota archaeon]
MSQNRSEDVIVVEGLTKVFNGNLTAVDHIDFSVKRGEIFGFLGPNGAGKTTTIKMLITVLRPTEGKASILGGDIAKQSMAVRSGIGVVPQEYTADEDLTAMENILLCADLYGIPRAVSKKRSLDLLNLVELTAFKDKRVQTFSGGMRRRLELACGLINRPKVLFLDEPTLGLDVQTRAATWNYVKMLKKEFGMTLFLTTHYLEEADALCDRIAIIDHGKIVVVGSPSELKDSLGGDIITLSIQKEQEDITEFIGKVEHVKEVKRENGSYTITSSNGELTAPLIIEALRKSGHVVTKLALAKPSLNEVYMQYTGKSMRDEESHEGVMSQRIAMRRAHR